MRWNGFLAHACLTGPSSGALLFENGLSFNLDLSGTVLFHLNLFSCRAREICTESIPSGSFLAALTQDKLIGFFIGPVTPARSRFQANAIENRDSPALVADEVFLQ